MIAVVIEVKVELGSSSKAFQRLASRIRDRRIPNRQLSTQLYSWVIRNYDSRGKLRPAGPWRPLAESTRLQKIRLGYSPEPLAPRSSNLRNSFLGFADNDTAGVGARASYGVDYAEVHEEGGRNVPARPMLPTRGIATEYALRVYQLFVDGAGKKEGLK